PTQSSNSSSHGSCAASGPAAPSAPACPAAGRLHVKSSAHATAARTARSPRPGEAGAGRPPRRAPGPGISFMLPTPVLGAPAAGRAVGPRRVPRFVAQRLLQRLRPVGIRAALQALPGLAHDFGQPYGDDA